MVFKQAREIIAKPIAVQCTYVRRLVAPGEVLADHVVELLEAACLEELVDEGEPGIKWWHGLRRSATCLADLLAK